jgi:predicted enzyme related to lactoylglutathione lyase
MPEFRVLFTATDYDATVSWFTEVAGLEILRSFEEGGRGTIFLAADGQIEVFANDDNGNVPAVSGAALAWEVADADAEHQRVAAAGAEVLFPPTMQPWGHKNFRIAGPDGWQITMFEIVVSQ